MKATMLFAAGLLVAVTGFRAEAAETQAVEWGRLLFKERCASCHGEDGKGNGPIAKALKEPPKDLTAIVERAGTKTFPEKLVEEIIDGRRAFVAHGDREMPVWGGVFGREEGSATADLEIWALAQYLGSIQAKKK